MATTACTSPNTVNLVGIVTGPLGSDGEIVTFKTPTPVWTNADYTNPSQVALQCNAVTLGGFNGLNS